MMAEQTNANRYHDLSPEILARRVLEMEDIARELAQATEEADRSLIKLQSLYDVTRQLSASLDVAEIMEKTVSSLTAMSYAQSCVLWTVGEGCFVAAASCGAPGETAVQMIPTADTSALTLAQRNRETAVVAAAETDDEVDRQLLAQMKATLMLAVPLAAQNDVLGLITLHGVDDRLVEDLELIQAVAQQAAVAIQNGQLYEEVQQLNQSLEKRIANRTLELVQEKERLETMHEITACLTTTLDLDQMISQTLQQLAQAVAAGDGMVLMNEDSFSSDLLCKVALDESGEGAPPAGSDHHVSHWVMANRQGILINDLQTEADWELAPGEQTRSVVATPLMADRDLHGVLLLRDDAAYQFTVAHLRLAESVAAQLATAINNARLHEYVTEQVVRLGDMLRTQEVEASQKQAFLASIADGVIASDMSGQIMLANPAAAEILGEGREEIIGRSVRQVFDIFQDVGRDKILQAFTTLQDGSAAGPDEMREIMLEAGRRVINARLTMVVTAQQETIGVVIVLRDITKEVEAARAKSEFISTVSHELRTPMTSIKGYTDLMRRGMVGALNEKQTHFMDVVYRNADRLSLLINDLLDVSRIEAGKIRLELAEADMADLAEQVVETLLIPAQEKGLALRLKTEPEIPPVKVDRDRIIQVMTNLVGNALAYTEAGEVTVSVCPAPDAVHVSVSDTGIGIPADELPHVFERFYRSDHEVVQGNSGTGLGLSIVHDFIEMHGGRIWVESEAGQGSTFSFILPV